MAKILARQLCVVTGAVAAVMALGLSTARAAVPATVSFQGRLLAADGSPEAGILSVGFALYGDPSGGTPLWSETQTVAFSEGFYAVNLGAISPLPISVLQDPLYLSVTVAGTELLPRMPVVSVPFALRAAISEGLTTSATGAGSGLDADSVDGLDSSDLADAETLDGMDSSAFAPSTHTHGPADADTLDGMDATDFATAGHGHAGIPSYYQATQSATATVADSTWTAIPGTSITFSVPTGGADVDLYAYGSVVADNVAAPAYTHCGFRFVVDGTGQGNATWGDLIVGVSDTSGVSGPWWEAWNIRRVTPLSSGMHTVSLEMIGWTGSPDICRVDTPDYSAARLYVTVR